MSLLANSADANELKLGDPIPSVQSKDQSGETVSFEKAAAEKEFLLVYFYPKADTPGCTAQACSLRDNISVLTAKNVKILGVSNDDEEAQTAFRSKYDLPFSLVADTDKSVAKAFDVPARLGFYSRQAFLFQNGKLVWKDSSASTGKQAEDILAFLNQDES